MNHFRLAWCTSQGNLWRISQLLDYVDACISCFHMNNDAGRSDFKIVYDCPELRMMHEAGLNFVAPIVPLGDAVCVE